MRRFVALVLCCLLFATTAYADNAASHVQSNATVSSDGSCQVSLTMSIRLDEPVRELELPLGAHVSGVRLNGSSASVRKSGGVSRVSLNKVVKNITGNVPVTITFTVNQAVTVDENGKQLLTVPLLYGFPYPVEQMSFSVTLPGPFDTVPTFLSGYHQQDIESSITSDLSGATVTGTVNTTLKDHETLTMTLEAPEGMFPSVRAAGGTLPIDRTAMLILGALALLYWLIAMSAWPRLPRRSITAPEGITAGNVGSYLTHRGADLTLMVISWAQMGYLLIHMDDAGRVMLHKKMDMGNERGAFEGRIFRSLFGKGKTIDATGFRYVKLCDYTAALSGRLAWGLRSTSGNPWILRLLGCGLGLFAGIAIGDCITNAPAWRVLLMFFLAVGGIAASWLIQEGFGYLRLRGWLRKVLSGILMAAFVILGVVSGCLPYGLGAAGGNALIGYLAACSGRRTENGDRIRCELLGLRRHMKQINQTQLNRILRTNTDYYYELAPYALAMGVDRAFARRFGRRRLPPCGWLIAEPGPAATAEDWYRLLRRTVRAMDALRARPVWEKLTGLRFRLR